MTKNDIINMLKFDQTLIDEALRRQIDGTCCLKTEDRDFIQDLFDKTNQAINDHISLEEESFLPQIASKDAILMSNEHKKIVALLDEARHALITERALSFKVLMQALKTSLSEHEQIETQIFRSLTHWNFNHEAILSIHHRISKNLV